MPGIVTVESAAATSDLTTLAAARLDLGIAAGDTSHDAYLSSLITRASGVISGHCGRAFGLETVSEVFRWRTGIWPYRNGVDAQPKPLVLARADVVSIASVTENGTLVDPGDYETKPAAGLVYRLRSGFPSWWEWSPNATVVYSAGWILPNDTQPPARTLPADVEDVALTLIRSAFASQGRDPSLAMDLVENVGRTQYFDRGASAMTLDDGLKEQLEPYRARIW